MIAKFRSLPSLARKLRRDLKGVTARKRTASRKGTTKVNGNDFALIFAHNGVGKTRLSMDFKDHGKRGGRRDTLYFNAFTEDLFDWENDFDGDLERRIRFKSRSKFFDGLDGMGIEDLIRPHLHRYADFNFAIDYTASEIRFFRDVLVAGRSVRKEDIKISRGEENLFIWCFFLAILQLAAEAKKGDPYDWVRYVYIDDPISSLDEHNTIALASDLGAMLRSATSDIKVVVSTHHGLFFNIMFNELKGKKSALGGGEFKRKVYVLSRANGSATYILEDAGESPFLHHVAALKELQSAAKVGDLSHYHCNALRSILEKTSVFFGRKHFSTCFDGLPKRDMYARFLNIRSHAKYSVYEPEVLHPAEKRIFREILDEFVQRYPFQQALTATTGGTP
ncbi:MAG TPA: AAA family ATPase [Luteimonas sp.]|nr:AAA family ATPase [Luteimonas sp.]